MMIRTRALFGVVLLVPFVASCAPDEPLTAPKSLVRGGLQTTLDETESPCAEYVIICEEDGDDPTVTYGTYTQYFPDLVGDGTAEYSVSQAEAASYLETVSANAVACPREFSAALVPATLFPPGEAPLPIASSGFWFMEADEMPLHYGRYRWPVNLASQVTEYMWPALDGSGRRVSIENADAHCYLLPTSPSSYKIHVSFYKYNGVEIKYRVRRTSSGGGGVGPDCHQEFVIVEINYWDGTGWHFLWEGTVTVCE